MVHRKTLLAFVLVAALGTACAGDVFARGPKCSSGINADFGVSGECTRTYDTLSEEATERIGVNTNDVTPSVEVTYGLSVETGRVSITFDTISTGTVSKTAEPGSPVTGAIRMTLDAFNQLKFRLTPEGGDATGVSYEIHFDCECMP